MSKVFTFKEVTDRKELENCLQFRYQIFSESATKVFIRENETKLDIDYYDIHSRHYCLTVDGTIAAYFRAVFSKDELTNETIIAIGEAHALLNRKDYESERAPFPFLSYKGVPDSQWNFYKGLQQKNEKLIEVSRLMVFPGYTSLRTAKHLTECAVVIYTFLGIGKSHIVINCLKEHEAFYKSYGFIPVANGEQYSVNDMNKMCLTLLLPLAPSLALSSISKKHHEKIEAMAKEFKLTGTIIKEL